MDSPACFHVKHIGDLSPKEASELKGAALFAGSFISVYHPSSILSGMLFCERMFDYIFEKQYDYKSKVFEEYAKIPFEALMEICPNKDKALRAICNIYGNKPSNQIHQSLAGLLEKNDISSIVTPNYDTCIDDSLTHQSRIVITSEDNNRILPGTSSNVYFKIHGTAAAGKENSVIYTLQQEGSLKDWQKKLLKQLLEQKTVLFIAYSGRDFDICPLIAQQVNYRKIYWLHFSKRFNDHPIREESQPELIGELSAYARYLLESNPENVLVVGDMIKLLNDIYGTTIDQLSAPYISFTPHQEFCMTPEELLEWRFRVLDRLGYASVGKELLAKYQQSLPPVFYLKMQTAFLAHEGSYRDATAISLQLAGSLNGKDPEKIRAMINAAAINIPLGKYGLCYRLFKKIDKTLNFLPEENTQDLKAEFIRIKFAYWMRLYQVSAKLPPLFVLTCLLKRKAIRLYKNAFQALSNSGSWDDRQMLQHNAERLNIPTDKTNISLPASVGFVNLGMPNMDIIRYRDTIRFEKKDQRELALEKVDEYIKRAHYLGIKTEVWKLSRLKFINKKLVYQDQLKAFALWRTYLKTTQYITLLELFYALECRIWLIIFMLKLKFKQFF